MTTTLWRRAVRASCATSLVIIAMAGCQRAAPAAKPASGPSTGPASLVASHQRHQPDLAWYAATGYTGGFSQPAPLLTHLCAASQMTAAAVTRRSADGVLGVITISGEGCTPGYTRGPRRLLDAAGEALPMTRVGLGHTLSTPGNFPSAIGAQPQKWGFAWRGSWCGAAAASVVMPRQRDRYDGTLRPRLVVPMSGPQPGCAHTSDSTFAVGVAGRPAEPLQAPAPGWSGLSTQLHVPRLRVGRRVAGLSVTLHNPTRRAIVLSPCPAYRIEVARGHGFSVTGPRPLPCSPSHRRIGPGRSVAIPLGFHTHQPRHGGARWRFTFIMGSDPGATTSRPVEE
jgi:hypothetical protein